MQKGAIGPSAFMVKNALQYRKRQNVDNVT